MVGRALQDTFKNSEIRDHASGIEVLVPIEDDFITIRSDIQIRITRIDGTYMMLGLVKGYDLRRRLTSDKIVLLNDEFLQLILLLISSDEIGGRRPQQMVA